VFAGIGHLTHQRQEFQAQVPDWFPIDADVVVLVSGAVELVLGAALVLTRRHRALVGWVVAAFFVVIFPGNVAQWLEGTDAFGLDTDATRFAPSPSNRSSSVGPSGPPTPGRSGAGMERYDRTRG